MPPVFFGVRPLFSMWCGAVCSRRVQQDRKHPMPFMLKQQPRAVPRPMRANGAHRANLPALCRRSVPEWVRGHVERDLRSVRSVCRGQPVQVRVWRHIGGAVPGVHDDMQPSERADQAVHAI